jgi:prepilin-type N-terminal cleavage/methylation domain-containing protein
MKDGFTLIELLLVLIIVAIIYTLAFNTSITKIVEEEDAKITFANIKKTLLRYKKADTTSVELICTNDSMGCYLFVDGNYTENTFELEQTLTDYFITKDDEAMLMEYPSFKIEEDEIFPNFKYTIYKNNANSDNLVELKDGSFVYFDPFFTLPKSFANSVDAIRYIHKFEYMPQQSGISSD